MTTLPSRVVKPPASPKARVLWSADSNGSSSWAVIGEVVMFHLRDALYVDGTVDVERLRPIARLSKNNCTRCGDIFEMIRPK